jgi:4-hydroxybenzoate polyprenyltransferase
MLRRILLRIGDFVFVTRPLILIPVWSFFLLGTGTRGVPWPGRDGALGYSFLCLTAIMVTAYLINQIFDRETDRHNNKGHYLTRGIFGVRTVVLMAMVTFAVASLSYQNTADGQRLPLALALVLSLIYSLPPIRLCARPFVDLAANAVGYGGIAFLVGHLAVDASVARGVERAIPYVLLVGATFMHTTILDIDGDRATGKITSSVMMGATASAWLALVLAALGLVWAAGLWWLRGEVLPVVLVGLSLPVYIRSALAHSRGIPERDRISSLTVQATTLIVTVAAAVIEPRYLLLAVPIVVASRFYYRQRFGVGYPGITRAAGVDGP